MRSLGGWVAAATFVVVAGCSGEGGSRAKLKTPAKGAYGEIVSRAAESPCGSNAAGLPVPTAPLPAREESAFGTDVLFYFAHPEDETLFTPGTMEALARARKRQFAVFLSHGEGGRLLRKGASGQIEEGTDVPPAQVAEVRDREIARVMSTLGIEYARLYPASANADFAGEEVKGPGRATHPCGGTYERWDALLPAGLPGLLEKLVADIRTRRPRVIVTHDLKDDEDFLDHGHHKALGALVDVAARAAADPRVPGGEPFVVEELVTIATKQATADLTLAVGNTMRKKLMTEHASQFDLPKFADVGQRTSERYVIRWRARPASGAPAGGASVFASLVSRSAAAPAAR